MDLLSNINNTHVTVIDQRMGCGKSTWAIQYIDTLPPQKSVMYVTPFVKEQERIIKSCKNKCLHMPDNSIGDHRKISSLIEHIQCDDDIVTTHALFLSFNDDVWAVLHEHNYTLILDEVIDPIVPVPVADGDYYSFLSSGRIRINEEGPIHYVEWDDKDSGDKTKYPLIREYAQTHNLVCVSDCKLVWQYPPEIFHAFSEIFLLTYRFDEGTCMKSYFDIYGITYSKKGLHRCSDGTYELSDYSEDSLAEVSNLIDIYHGDMNDNYKLSNKDSALSSNWWKNIGRKDRQQVSLNAQNFLSNICSGHVNNSLVTVFKASLGDTYDELLAKYVAEDGYAIKIKGFNTCTIPFNTRSTNNYRNRFNIAYLVNRYMNPSVKEFFVKQEHPVDEDKWALSEMIQFLWRSRIRNQFDESGNPTPDDQRSIRLYCPSLRMRNLLNQELGNSLEKPIRMRARLDHLNRK